MLLTSCSSLRDVDFLLDDLISVSSAPTTTYENREVRQKRENELFIKPFVKTKLSKFSEDDVEHLPATYDSRSLGSDTPRILLLTIPGPASLLSPGV